MATLRFVRHLLKAADLRTVLDVRGGVLGATSPPEAWMTTSDVPPTSTVKPVDPPPLSANPTSAQLKGDIDSGQTGDKNPVLDPGLAPLGTDDEAAGRPPSAFRIKLARRYERLERWIGRSRSASSDAHGKRDGLALGYLAFTGVVGVVLVGGIWLVRTGFAAPCAPSWQSRTPTNSCASWRPRRWPWRRTVLVRVKGRGQTSNLVATLRC